MTEYGVDKVTPTIKTMDPGSIKILYKAPIADSWAFANCACIICKEAVLGRTYHHVHENRIESNLAWPCCLNFIVCDAPYITYFDAPYVSGVWVENCCTPYHLCFCIPFCGEVSKAPFFGACTPWFFNCLCPACHRFFPGLRDAAEFSKQAESAYNAWSSAAPAQHGM